MGRIHRELYIHAIYHVYNRGNNRQDVLKDDEDKDNFLKCIDRYRGRFQFKIFAICLMDNHYHMIIETNLKHSISRIMHGITLSYSNLYRKRNEYVGHLWQGRFKSRVIEREQYFLECFDYIHQNPVRANIVDRSQMYKYSSAAVITGTSECVGGLLSIDSFNSAVNS